MKKKQAQIHDSISLRQLLVASRFNGSVTKLARALRHPRPTVSAALHHGRFPRVVAKIKEALHA